jgi:hypothetical protein
MDEAKGQEDPLNTSMTHIINLIEGFCRPVLLHSRWSLFRPSSWVKS